MILNYLLFVFFLSKLCSGFQAIDTLKPSASVRTQEDAVRELIKRTIPKDANKFSVEIRQELGPPDKDTFRIQSTVNGSIHIIGTTGVAVATGFHHYLKYYCNCHISWETENLDLPVTLPYVNITTTLNDRFRYYQNVCTTSYSFVWWNWTQWEKHIDWMALNSFNLVLTFNGLESVWKKVYLQMNLTVEEIDEHFGGPAFLSWSRMGNIRGWGGHLSEFWHRRSLVLQALILQKMRELGMIPVLPAFDGHVPRAFIRLFPHAKINTTSVWNKFQDKYCCPYLLDPTDPLFQTVGTAFLTEVIATFGTDHAYSCDTFNEMQPSSGDVTYLSKMGQSVYNAMESVDHKAIWIMQNWLFVHDFPFWTESRAEALLTSVPQGKMIVLDLQSEQFPQYRRLKSYFGQPYIWCMLHNFGGTLGMFGSANIINEEIFKARNSPNSTLIGTGVTAEGINQNYVIYDLMNEMAWRSVPANLSSWFTQYANRRYGENIETADGAWQLFKDTVYNFDGLFKMRGKYAYNQRPRTRIYTWTWYNTYNFLRGWDMFLQSADSLRNSTGYLHDLVDTTRQFLQILGDEYYKEIVASFKLNNVSGFQSAATQFLDIFQDLELILASNKAFLLGVWLKDAKTAGYTKEHMPMNMDYWGLSDYFKRSFRGHLVLHTAYAYLPIPVSKLVQAPLSYRRDEYYTIVDKELFEYNARNQITLWGPRGEIVDYANKQWSGIVSKYFLPRWAIFLRNMNDSLINKTRFNETTTILQMFKEVEQPFTFDRSLFPDTPTGDTVEIARDIHKKWWKLAEDLFTKTKYNEYYSSLNEMPLKDQGYDDDPIVYVV